MLVYGDRSRRAETARLIEELEERRNRLTALPAGLERHSALAALFIELGSLAQGVADAQSSEVDKRSSAADALLDHLQLLGGMLLRSWNSDFADAADPPPIPALATLPTAVEVKLVEGYAHYALYPEGYVAAALRLELTGAPRVIGLRSIGTGLGGMVAAALGAGRPVTVRPRGHPFDRKLELAPELERDLLSNPRVHFIIVDEGPGLSGSSFGAVADWLEDRGVAIERIAFVSGHDNPLGVQASERHRRRWQVAQRVAADSDALLAERLPHWVDALAGPLEAPLENLSAGAWRSRVGRWPAINPMWERRKYLARAGGSEWLVKFAGLGEVGEEKLELAGKLHAAGAVAEPLGLAHGWLVERWHGDARPGRPSLDELTRYLQLRAAMPADRQGASLAKLLVMARHNAPDLLGDWSPDVEALQRQVEPVIIDGRMAPHEWLRLPDGQLLKADALDHHAAHDLVGCQDIAWDIAGAVIELGLSESKAAELATRLNRPAELLDFYLLAYAAFRIGAHRLTVDMLGHWPEEAERNRRAAEGIERWLSGRRFGRAP